MNIAIVASSFHPHLGGVEELVRQLALAQLTQGHHPMVCTNRWPKDLPAREQFQGFPLRRYAFRVPAVPGKMTWAAKALGPFALLRFCSELKAFRTQLIHIQCVSSAAQYAIPAARYLGVPLVVTLQGELTMDPAGIYQRPGFSQTLLRRSLDRADFITGCSAKTLRDAEDFYGRPFGERSAVIFNGARIDDFDHATPYSHPRPYIFALGRLVPQKGFDILLRAFATDELASHDLLLAGSGAEIDNLKSLAAQLGISQRVHFLGHCDRARTVSLFKGAQFFVLPSRADEGLPVVSAEAMAAGVATVATATGGTPEAVVPEETGLLVPREDPLALRAAMIRVAGDPVLRATLAAGACKRAPLFSWPVIARQYEDMYRRVLEKHAAKSAAPQRATAPAAT